MIRKVVIAVGLLLLLTGCSVEGAKGRQTAMNEYNEIIVEYNGVSRSVTSLAKHVHTVLEEGSDKVPDEKFWETYDERREKVKEEIANLRGYKIKDLTNRKIEDKLDPYLEKAEEYMTIDEVMKTDLQDAKKLHKIQYDELIRLSNDATLEFDVIYNEIMESGK